MNTISIKSFFVILLSLILLAGCGSKDVKPVDDDNIGDETSSTDHSSNGTSGIPEEAIRTDDLSDSERDRIAKQKEEEALRAVRIFYFDFDRADLKIESRLPLMAHARYLAANPNEQIIIEGHTDERGTKGYNMALGERRAETVARFLVLNGASRSQIEVISYGEENPVSFGQNEEAWAMNRRAVIVYQ